MMFKVYAIISRVCLLISETLIRMANWFTDKADFWIELMTKEAEEDASRKTT